MLTKCQKYRIMDAFIFIICFSKKNPKAKTKLYNLHDE